MNLKHQVKQREKKTSETNIQYLNAAKKYANRAFWEIRNSDHYIYGERYNYGHESHAAAAALELTEARFVDLDTFGVEGDSKLNGEGHISHLYLNSGDSYEPTLFFFRGRFIVSNYCDIVGRAMR